MSSDNLSKVPIHSVWDKILCAFTLLICVILFWQKSIFLFSFVETVSNKQFLLLLVVNLATYLGVFVWVYLVLSYSASVLMRIYILLVGVIFTLLTRMVESGEEMTRQGVDFDLANHFFLALLGHQGLAETLVTVGFQWGLFFVLFLGLLGQYIFSGGRRFSKLMFLLFLIFSALAFVSPEPDRIPRSLGQNGLIYLVKSAWLPVPDVSVQRAGLDVTEVNVTEVDVAKSEAFEREKTKDTQWFAKAEGMNVAIITLESTSANLLSFYPNSDAFDGSTPFLEKMASHSLFFNETSSVMASTTKSLVTILCGIEPYLKTDVFEVTLGVPAECLARRLSEKGYDTAFFQSATKYYEGRDRLVENLGIQTFVAVDDLDESDLIGKQKIGSLGYEDMVMLDRHEQWLREKAEHKSEPFLAFYLTLAQHHPYLPVDHDERFKVYDENRYLNDFVNSLSYVDHYLEQIIEQYKSQGLYENTLFVFVGDHGESFGRYHQPWFHNNVMYREGVWVPFYISSEKLFSKRENLSGEFSLIDVAPSVEYLLGMPVNTGYTGQVFTQVLGNKERRVFSACWYKKRCLAVSDAQYKYIYNFGDMPDELYDRSRDFREQKNLAEAKPVLVGFYKHLLLSWYSDVLVGYDNYYKSKDDDYLLKPDSYYQFPMEIIPNKDEVERW